MKFGKSDWEKHSTAMQEQKEPYWENLWSAINNHKQKLPTDGYGNRISFDEHEVKFIKWFGGIDELVTDLDVKEKSSNDDKKYKYYPPLSLFGIKRPEQEDKSKHLFDYVILLNSNRRYWNWKNNPSNFLCRLIAQNIAERGLYFSGDPLSKLDKYIPKIDFLPNMAGYMCYAIKLRNTTKEIDNDADKKIKRDNNGTMYNFWNLTSYQTNIHLLDRFARDIGQFQRVINCEEYNSAWKGFEVQFGEAIQALARSFAVIENPEIMIKGIAGTVLLGKMFRK